ncbi:MAG: DNA repair protein [Ruminococcus sp.]|nr:DNA repair protein [Ruminococcus sp.]
MTDKELRKLSRAELLKLLVAQGRELEQLKTELDDAKQQLANRQIVIENSGSIAEAALKLNEVFEAAQKAADLYVENIKLQNSDNTVERDL